MSDVAIHAVAHADLSVYNLNRAHELRALRETLHRSFPNLDPEKVAESVALALRAGGSHQNRAEIIGLAKMYLAGQG